MKASTLLAIVAAVAGVAFIAWLATRPRGATSAALGEGEGTTEGETSGGATRATRAFGTALTEAAAGIAELAS